MRVVQDYHAGNVSAWIVASTNVVLELEDNRSNVQSELEKGVRKLKAQLARMATATSALLPEREIVRPDWIDDEFSRCVGLVLDRLVDSMSFYEGSSDCKLRASDRVYAGVPPSSKSTQQYKDCAIFEEFLELARSLRESGFQGRLIFVSSNKNDYGPPPVGASRIAEDLAEHGAEYVASLDWALASIRNEASPRQAR